MPNWNRLAKAIYAATIVFPVARSVITHLYLMVVDSYNEIREKWQEALRGS